MKNNAKRLAALLMILTLLFSVSATAFASTVYSNIISVDATEKPEETVEPEVTEEPVDPEATVVPETPEEPAPTYEEVLKELLADVTITVKCEIISVGEVPAFGDTVKLTALVTGAEDVDYEIVWEYRANSDETEWFVYEVAVEDREVEDNSMITFPLSLDNYTSEWRARLVPIIPEGVALDEPAAQEESADETSEEPAAQEETVNEEPAPAAQEPAVEEAAPAVEEPVVEQPAPAVEEPVVEQPAPAVEETVVEETVPAVEETVVEEPAPAVEEPVVEEVPAA